MDYCTARMFFGLLLVVGLSPSLLAQEKSTAEAQNLLRQADGLLRASEYEQAADKAAQAAKLLPENPRVLQQAAF